MNLEGHTLSPILQAYNRKIMKISKLIMKILDYVIILAINSLAPHLNKVLDK